MAGLVGSALLIVLLLSSVALAQQPPGENPPDGQAPGGPVEREVYPPRRAGPNITIRTPGAEITIIGRNWPNATDIVVYAPPPTAPSSFAGEPLGTATVGSDGTFELTVANPDGAITSVVAEGRTPTGEVLTRAASVAAASTSSRPTTDVASGLTVTYLQALAAALIVLLGALAGWQWRRGGVRPA